MTAALPGWRQQAPPSPELLLQQPLTLTVQLPVAACHRLACRYGGDEVDLTQGMRNWLAFDLTRASGRYAARTVWCEVFLQDSGAAAAPSGSGGLSLADYHGIYIAMEKLKIVSLGAAPDWQSLAVLRRQQAPGGQSLQTARHPPNSLHCPPLLCCSLEQSPQRVNLSKLAPPNLSGGFLFVYDNDNIEAGDVTLKAPTGWEHPFVMK
jgi:hypothetical protein